MATVKKTADETETAEVKNVTAKVLRTFKDKHTGEIHKKGTTIKATEERLAEINSVKTFVKRIEE